MTLTSPYLESRISNHVGFVLLNRPENHNAISRQMWLDIPSHMQSLMKQGARLIVLQGAGGAFAAGADVFELKNIENLEEAKINWEAIAQTLEFVHSFSLPTIAAVNGSCLGGGCLLAASCDLRYASLRSRFSVPIARLGLVIDDVTLARLSALIGLSRTKDLVFRARVIDAEQAHVWGLVNEVFPDQNFDQDIQNVCKEILDNSHLSIMEAKASFSRFTSLTSSNSENEELVVASYLGPDFKDRLSRLFKRS